MSGRLIGLIGPAEDVASALVAAGWKRYGITTVVREALLALNPLMVFEGAVTTLADVAIRRGWPVALEDPYVRGLERRLRFDVGRVQMGEHCWIDAVLKYVDIRLAKRPRDIVVTDLAFPNEADAVRARGGVIFRVVGPEAPRSGHMLEDALDGYRADCEVRSDAGSADVESALGTGLNLELHR